MASGTENKNAFWVNNSGNWVDFSNNYEYFKVKKRQNQMSEFEIKLYDISTAQKAYFKEQTEVLFFAGTIMILKGRIQTIEWSSAYEVIAKGFGMEVKLLDKEFIKAGDNRIQYTNESAQTIATEINDNILTTASSGIFASDYGDVSLRFEYANRLNALGKLSEATDYNWWVSQTSSDTYSADYLHFDSNQGETSSQKTYDLTSSMVESTQEKDITNLVNYVHALGYGDGINQLSTSCYAASTQSSLLSANIASTDTSISLIDASDFDSSGTARIAKEQVAYLGISSNTLTGCTRGTGSTTAKAHNINCYVEQHYTTTSAQTGSSIQVYGLMDKTLIDKTIIDEETLEVISSRYLLDRKTPILRIRITPDEPLDDVALNIGDNVTITDSESDINGSYRIVGQEYESNYGYLKLTTEVSNRSLEFIEQMNKAKQDAENQAKYMQGATNIYALTETENVDAGHPLNMRFYIPSEAVAINKVLLNFKMEDFRSDTYEENTQYIALSAYEFNSNNPDIDDIHYAGCIEADADNLTFSAPITLPDGAILEKIIVYGSNTSKQFRVWRINHDGVNGNVTALTNMDSEATPYNGRDIIDNKTYNYYIVCSDVDNTEKVYGGRIEYNLKKIGISEETLSNQRVVVTAGLDGSETTVGTYTANQTDLDITSKIQSAGSDAWANIKFESEGGTQLLSQQTESDDIEALGNGYALTLRRIMQRLYFTNQKLKTVAFQLSKYGSPTGNIDIEIRKVDGDELVTTAVLTTSESLPSNNTTSPAGEVWVTGSFDYPITLLNEEVRVGIGFTGGDGSNWVWVRDYNTDSSIGYRTGQNTSGTWIPETAQDLTYKFWFDEGRMRINANAYAQVFLESK